MKHRLLMNPVTGSVDTEASWRATFSEVTPEEWGGMNFEDAGLVEVIRLEDGTYKEV